jgi:hypothetical protein
MRPLQPTLLVGAARRAQLGGKIMLPYRVMLYHIERCSHVKQWFDFMFDPAISAEASTSWQ